MPKQTKGPKDIKEYQIVNHISEYMRRRAINSAGKTQDQINTEMTNQTEITKKIEEFVAQTMEENNYSVESEKVLREALLIQYNIYFAFSNRKNLGTSAISSNYLYSNNFIIFPVGSGSHHGGHGGGGCSGEGFGLVVVLVTLGSAIVASYGMGKDLYEISQEMFSSQRINANIVTLTLTSAYVTGAVLGTMAIAAMASNPVLCAVLVGASFVIMAALLVKVTRQVVNIIDALLIEESGLIDDSRFRLTDEELDNFKEKGLTDKGLDKVKAMIRGLAVQARDMPKTGFFGSEKNYLAIIDTLTEIKKGSIPQALKDRYELSSEDYGDLPPPSYDASTSTK